MKDIYELLNDVDLDENEYKEMEVSEWEKAQIKKTVKRSIKKRKAKRWKKNVVTAAIVTGLSVATFGLTFPTHASNVPIIGDIFRFLDNGRTGLYENYKEYSTEMNLSQESNGIKVTINDAVYDGKTVSLTFSLESDRDLGDDPYLEGNLDILETSGGTGMYHISKVGDSQYVGLITGSTFDGEEKDHVKVKWEIDSILLPTDKNIKGTWDFALALDAPAKDTHIIDQSVEQKGVKVSVGKVSVTPMSLTVYYEQMVSEEIKKKWHAVDVDITIKDDLGNDYSGEGNGGSSDSDNYHINWSKTFEKIDPNATKLIITPHVEMYEYTPENFGGAKVTTEETTEVRIPSKYGKGNEEFVLDDIIVQLK
ncbi:ECF-type sigma factor negative effector [Siminovitchia terrae]|uniref:ECF-type sigma factor negative effector n=1 Tax=Siminovitchia terrae TaxID=1914933 RepID=A0ABQ4KY49_SIMTE|nr:DUF4179 domain-containing protein [Siminovitchia terrae]GIN96597.1 ECF-type sigma factor negative effector [Siminovitchia terrae]